uniref:Serine protease n=1 Tax=Meloidogyne javanica TaxID=6303 RepID=A0A915MWD0_MELJA
MDRQLNDEINSAKSKIAQLETKITEAEAYTSEWMQQYAHQMFLEMTISKQQQMTQLQKQVASLEEKVTLFEKQLAAQSTNSGPSEKDAIIDKDWINKFIFFTEEGGYRSCVVALTPHYLITFRHGTHRAYVNGVTIVRVFSAKSRASYNAAVVHICEEEDYVILKSREEVVDRECPLQHCEVMRKFVVCGFANGLPELTFDKGIVHSTHPYVYENDGKRFGPFVYGTAKTSRGDSGAACFGTSGLMAINLGVTSMPLKYHTEAIAEAAIFSPNNYMLPAVRLFEVVAKLEPKKPPKKPHQAIKIEGYGTVEF